MFSGESFNSISERAVDEYVAIHQAIKNLVLPQTGYMWIQQPLVFWGKKTRKERAARLAKDSGQHSKFIGNHNLENIRAKKRFEVF